MTHCEYLIHMLICGDNLSVLVSTCTEIFSKRNNTKILKFKFSEIKINLSTIQFELQGTSLRELIFFFLILRQ